MSKTVRCSFVSWVLLLGAATGWAGPLEDYVNRADPSYAYSKVAQYADTDFAVYLLDMTSQTWNPGDVDKPVWKHWVTVFVPYRVTRDTALLIVAGGNNKHDQPPDLKGREARAMAQIVTKTGGVGVILQGVPSEPLVFREEGRSRSEDEIIAYTYRKFIDTGNPDWPLLLPMVKSAVRAMDATQDFLKTQAKPTVDIKHFVVTGASKRGWTTWLTGAVDKRVVGIAPMVIDVLNMSKQMTRQKEYYGTYSDQVQDYTDLNLTDLLSSPEAQPLLSIVDPYSYRNVLTMPKLVLVGTSDQYWTVDAAQLYFPDLLPEKYIRYEPNGDHGLDRAEDTIKSLANFYYCVAAGKPMPKFTWDISANGTYVVTPQEPTPVEVRLWRAHSDIRDFRKVTIGEAWKSEVLTPASDGSYRGSVRGPGKGYDAFFIELVYSSPIGGQHSLTTLTCIPDRGFGLVRLALLGLPVLLLVTGAWWVYRR